MWAVTKVGIPNFVSGPREYIMEGEYVILVSAMCMHGMNQTEAEYPRRSKRSQTASLIQIGPVVLEI